MCHLHVTCVWHICVTYNNLVWYSYIWHTCITFICHIHVAYMRHLISCQACSNMSHIYVDWIYRMCFIMSYKIIYEGIYDNLYFIRNIYVHKTSTYMKHVWHILTYTFRICRLYVSYMFVPYGKFDSVHEAIFGGRD